VFGSHPFQHSAGHWGRRSCQLYLIFPFSILQERLGSSPGGQPYHDTTQRLFLYLDGMPRLEVCRIPVQSDLPGRDILCDRGNKTGIFAEADSRVQPQGVAAEAAGIHTKMRAGTRGPSSLLRRRKDISH